MTQFVNPQHPTSHLGIERMSNGFASLRQITYRIHKAKGLVALLLAGVVSALVVVADQVVSTWTEGDLFAAWVALWVLVFAALAFFAEASRGWSDRLVAMWKAYRAASARRAADETIWSAAQSDPRLMADLDMARARADWENNELGGVHRRRS